MSPTGTYVHGKANCFDTGLGAVSLTYLSILKEGFMPILAQL